MKKDFIAVYSIICPHCNIKQTGVVRAYDMTTSQPVLFEDPKSLPPSIAPLSYPAEQFGIKCSWSKCAQLIVGDQLDNVTRKAVKSPSDIYSKP